jgi:hypothetical protein
LLQTILNIGYPVVGLSTAIISYLLTTLIEATIFLTVFYNREIKILKALIVIVLANLVTAVIGYILWNL